MSAKGRSRARICPEARSAEGSPMSAEGPPQGAGLRSVAEGRRAAPRVNQ